MGTSGRSRDKVTKSFLVAGVWQMDGGGRWRQGLSRELSREPGRAGGGSMCSGRSREEGLEVSG